MTSRNMAAPAAALLVALLILNGCSSGGGGGIIPPPPPHTFTVQGRVVAADHPTQGIPLATLGALPSGTTGATANDGSFTLAVPVGAVTLNVTPTVSPGYQATAVTIPATNATTVTVMVALLPVGAATPTAVILQPQATTVEIGASVQFSATVQTSSGVLPLAASWLSLGTAGTFSINQVFNATAVGVNTIYVFSGPVGATTTITVVGQRGPILESVVVDPLSISASGGTLTMTVAATDGQGVASVVANIVPLPSGAAVPVPLILVAGDSQSGTYRATWPVPANSNLPNSRGVQAPQTYAVRFTATDLTARATLSDFIHFVVQGLSAPPPPPPG